MLTHSGGATNTLSVDSAGTLSIGSASVATSTDLALKQNVLASYVESGANAFFINTQEGATPIPLYLAWDVGSYTNQTGFQLVGSATYGVYESLINLPSSGTMYLSVEFQAGTTNEVIFAANDSTQWSGHQSIKFTGLSSSWQTFTYNFSLYSNGKVNFHLLIVPPGSGLTQAAGNVKMRHLQLWTAVPNSVINRNLTVQGDITCTGAISCVSVTQTSDESIKQNIMPASLGQIMKAFEGVEVQTYERTDIDGPRIGFVAQDFVKALPSDYGNIVSKVYRDGIPLWSLDYARLVTILWGVCKRQEVDIAALANRVTALEARKRK